MELSHGIREEVSCSGILIASVNHLDFLLFNSEFPVSKMIGLEMLLFSFQVTLVLLSS